VLTRPRLGYAGSYSPTAAPLTPRSESINPRMAKGDKTPHLC